MITAASRFVRTLDRARRARNLRVMWAKDQVDPRTVAARLRYLGLTVGGADRARHRRRKASRLARRVTWSRR
jgi:hypothetical protein